MKESQHPGYRSQREVTLSWGTAGRRHPVPVLSASSPSFRLVFKAPAPSASSREDSPAPPRMKRHWAAQTLGTKGYSPLAIRNAGQPRRKWNRMRRRGWGLPTSEISLGGGGEFGEARHGVSLHSLSSQPTAAQSKGADAAPSAAARFKGPRPGLAPPASTIGARFALEMSSSYKPKAEQAETLRPVFPERGQTAWADERFHLIESKGPFSSLDKDQEKNSSCTRREHLPKSSKPRSTEVHI
ncbi:hypothetical protein AAFF_G00274370 [Aldrovandia affinis]|uniref:Uncharacterized protein n=1 Tax=Aldrovandia affinis TaxID=143900 RepID=A0AAD7WSP1_9TELE|nr:hypothetical protein AAFF_G00274370 [Aldrovandia affinis]